MLSLPRQPKWSLSSLHVSLKKTYGICYTGFFSVKTWKIVFKAEKSYIPKFFIFAFVLLLPLPVPFVAEVDVIFLLFFYNENIANFNLNSWQVRKKTINSAVRFAILTPVLPKIPVSRDVTSCPLLNCYRSFEEVQYVRLRRSAVS